MPPLNRSPPSTATPPPSSHDLKQRVVACLNKLSDRDTIAVAAAELESIARNLTQDSFSPFLNCLHATDYSTKSPVRKQCVSLLSLLSQSHGDSLSPHLPKMISTVLRRIRDPDSAVRTACAVASADMSSRITASPFSVVFTPLMDALVQEHDSNAQIGAAMCLAAAVEAAPDPEAEQLKKALPRLVKLLKSDGFRAKPAVLGAIGSMIVVGGVGSKGVLDSLVPCVTEFLSSDDWATRKAAAEALSKIANLEELAPQYKKTCVVALEKKKFDKVKIVRETMFSALSSWKEVAGDDSDLSSASSLSRSSSTVSTDKGSVGCFRPSTKSTSADPSFKTARPTKGAVYMRRSPPPTVSSMTPIRKERLKGNDKSTIALKPTKSDNKDHTYCKIVITDVSPKSLDEDNRNSNDNGVAESGENRNHRPEIKRVLFRKSRNLEVQNNGGLRSSSRVVPCNDDDKSSTFGVSYDSEEAQENQKDAENIIFIQEQLAQIEHQQTNLLALLQRFIGSSQNGILSLESRVSGIEMALGEISYGLAVNSRRIPKSNDTCCKLPGAEFLSPKFWRKTESRSSPRLSSTQMQPQESTSSCVVNHTSDGLIDSNGRQIPSNRIGRNSFHDRERVQGCNADGFGSISSATRSTSVNLTTRLST